MKCLSDIKVCKLVMKFKFVMESKLVLLLLLFFLSCFTCSVLFCFDDRLNCHLDLQGVYTELLIQPCELHFRHLSVGTVFTL